MHKTLLQDTIHNTTNIYSRNYIHTYIERKKKNIVSYKENEKEVQVAFKGVNKGVSVLYLVQLVVISHT